MRSKGYYLVLAAMSVKFMMDFFMPARDVAFIAFNGTLIVLVLAFGPALYASRRTVFWSVVFMAFVIAELYRDATNPIAYKLLTLPLLAMLFYSLGRKITGSEMSRVFKLLLVEFLICFSVNYAISAALGLTASRDFWNFEHANLLGSYVLIMLLPINYVLSQTNSKRQGPILKALFVAVACLTTSTGAMVLSLTVFLRIRKVSVRRLASPVIMGVVLLCTALVALSLFNAAIYDKIVAPVVLIADGGWMQLFKTAQSSGGITHLASDQQGSFTWRIYAYLVYAFYVARQGLWPTMFGNGIGGYEDVWNGAMPHNDFILMLVDLGAIFLLLVVFNLIRLLRHVIRRNPQWLLVVLALLMRLAFENNIYSYYLMSNFIVFAALICGAMSGTTARLNIG
ncbi:MULTISPECIES: hypothetical protein [Paraburkholderia]|uniref:hypothetical protein n=1 Tax=Paraburkholderia TaxID=1822464 RepID=UPI00224E506D|nr:MULTISPECIES: hypothetical protein [Paraburkholderia]MCX4161561.1 hypothetical protein [Paraburkholderia megapolitana]MDN7157057.1 hypothetical protein [Paraburkholderia sp. CHISQ3]MDQ6494102.1 hypothetical protein [Paraburkholderia megapolitana]